jgi:hypothetical protein
MGKVFEDDFMEAQSEFISLCMEVVENKVDCIYVYIYNGEHNRLFNVFFSKNRKTLTLNQMGISHDLTLQLLRTGTYDIQNLINVCSAYNKKCPKQFKLIYNVNTGGFDADYSYDDINWDTTSAAQTFMAWLNEINTQIK